MVKTTISGHEVRNLHWHDEGIKGYYGEVFYKGGWMMFMWNDRGQTGNPGFNININSPTLAEAYEAGFEYAMEYPDTPRTNDEVKQHYSRLHLAQLHYNPSQKTAFSTGMRDGQNGQKINWEAFFDSCKVLVTLLSAIQPYGSISVFEFRGGWWGITGEETEEQLKQISNDYISFFEIETESAKHDLH